MATSSTTLKHRQRREPLPISATVAKLIAQVQAEAEAATLDALSAKDGILVLQPIERSTARFDDWGDTLVFGDANGAVVRYYQRRELPESWRGGALERAWHPSHFAIYITRVDGRGRRWETSLGKHVIDDFGDLVCVEGGEA